MITKKKFKNQTKTWSKLENNMNPALKQVLVYLPISKLQLLSSTVFFHNIISQGLESHSINYYYLEWAMHNIVWKNNESFRRFYPP